jgi:hypothetical protein
MASFQKAHDRRFPFSLVCDRERLPGLEQDASRNGEFRQTEGSSISSSSSPNRENDVSDCLRWWNQSEINPGHPLGIQ